MEQDFLITKIERIIFVDKDEYSEKVLTFDKVLPCNELIFHLTGESTVYFNGMILDIHPNIIRFLPKGETNEYHVDRKIKGACIDIFFQADRPISDKAFTWNATNNNRLASLFKKAFTVWVSKRDGYYFECLSLLYKIFSEMQKQTYLPEKEFAKIRPAVDYINEHFISDSISSEMLSEMCGISYSYLKQLFIKKFGVSPKKYAIGLKMNCACDLLLSNMYTISQVSEQCGYSDIYFFSRQFKEYMGLSPSKFIKKYKSSK